jgi:hypothetical protein
VRTPRTWPRPTSSSDEWAPDAAELHVARRRVGAHVERERHRQQALVLVPVDLDVDVEAGASGAQ